MRPSGGRQARARRRGKQRKDAEGRRRRQQLARRAGVQQPCRRLFEVLVAARECRLLKQGFEVCARQRGERVHLPVLRDLYFFVLGWSLRALCSAQSGAPPSRGPVRRAGLEGFRVRTPARYCALLGVLATQSQKYVAKNNCSIGRRLHHPMSPPDAWSSWPPGCP